MSDVTKSMTAVDKSIKAMRKASEDVLKARTADNTMLQNFADTLGDLLTDIEFKTSERDALDMQFADKFRIATAELKIKVLEDEDAVLYNLMDARNLANIDESALETLEDALGVAKSGNADAIDKAVDSARSSDAMTYRMKENSATAEHKVAIANLESSNTSLASQVAHLETSIVTLNMTIDSERAARVQIAASESNAQGVVVNTSAK